MNTSNVLQDPSINILTDATGPHKEAMKALGRITLGDTQPTEFMQPDHVKVLPVETRQIPEESDQ